jgi:hypothetical protein
MTVFPSDAQWAFREQLALAAIDMGNLAVADVRMYYPLYWERDLILSTKDCLRQLSVKFPESPRVDVLTGIRMEATEPFDVVLKFYDHLLEVDGANGVCS